MALWQWRLTLIPEKALLYRYEVLPLVIPMELGEQGQWWADAQPRIHIEERIDEILVPVESWSTSMRMWGDEDGNNAYVSYVDERRETIDEIGFRLDARSIAKDLLSKVCMLTTDLGCVLLTSEYEILAPDESMLLDAMTRSNARRFVENPASTLQNLDRASLQDRIKYLTKSNKKRDSHG